MFLKSFVLLFLGFCGGVGVSAGTFAFLLVIHVVPRIIQKAKLQNQILYVENMIICGVLFGTILSLFLWSKAWLPEILGRVLLTVFGISAGTFVGCTAVALAEILDTFPIFFRRVRLDERFCVQLLLCMAIGKACGSLFYFCFGYGLQGG